MPASTPERAFVGAAVRALLVTAALTVPAGFALGGPRGALGAAAALAFLVVLFGCSSLLHALAAPHGRRLWLSLTLGGLGLRLAVYVVLIRTLGQVEALDVTALGLAAATGIVVGQVFELHALARTRAGDGGQAPAPPPASATTPAGLDLKGAHR